MQLVEEYLRELETTLSCGKSPGGYERFFEREMKRRVPILLMSRRILWASMAVGSAGLFAASLGRAHGWWVVIALAAAVLACAAWLHSKYRSRPETAGSTKDV